MKKLNVTLIGDSPLIMHSPKCVNPLHPISLEMKKYTSKKKKTEEDVKEHVSSLMPFLELDETEESVFHLTPLNKKGE